MKSQGVTFRKERVRLDFNEFKNCAFHDCEMVYGGYGPVSMSDCEFGNVKWVFVDAAANTVQFMAGMYRGAGEGGRRLIEQTIEDIKRGLFKASVEGFDGPRAT
jgi:hypothetical protein